MIFVTIAALGAEGCALLMLSRAAQCLLNARTVNFYDFALWTSPKCMTLKYIGPCRHNGIIFVDSVVFPAFMQT